MVTQHQAPVIRRRYIGAVGWCDCAGCLLAALLLPIAACTIGPDFTAPVAPLAEKFRGAGTRSVQSGPLEYQNWWEGFRDPTLNRLIQIAYNQNLTLLSAGTRVLQARAVLGDSHWHHLSAGAAGGGFGHLQPYQRRNAAVGPECDAVVFLDRCPCGTGSLGAGLLGQVSSRGRIRRRRVSGVDRVLRQRSGVASG